MSVSKKPGSLYTVFICLLVFANAEPRIQTINEVEITIISDSGCNFTSTFEMCEQVQKGQCIQECQRAILEKSTHTHTPTPHTPTPTPTPDAVDAPSPMLNRKLMILYVGPVGESDLGFAVGGAGGIENFRRSIEENFLPSPYDITYEGIFNEYYFDTKTIKSESNESAGCEQLFCAEYSIAISKEPLQKSPVEYDFYITVGLESGLSQKNFARKALNIVVVLDISGSMGESFIQETDNDPEKIGIQFDSKLDVAKKAVIDMLQQLNNNDTLSIVTFADFAETLIELTPVEELNLENVRDQINQLRDTSNTNMEAGYLSASQILKNCVECMLDNTYDNRIIFLTDAQPNLGDTTAIGLSNQTIRNAGINIYTTFIGIGLDFNTQLSEIMTKTRGANYFVVKSPEDFRTKLSEEFDFMVTPLVFDVKLEINASSFNNGNGWKVIKVYGSPNLDGGLDKNGTFVEISTLFPSPKTPSKGTKGGVVLLKMQKPQNSEQIPLILKVSYKDRITLENVDSFSEVKIPEDILETEYFDSSGAQKAVLLARYVDLLRGWIIDQHLLNTNQNWTPIVRASSSSTEDNYNYQYYYDSQLYTQQQSEQQQFRRSVLVSTDLCQYYPEDRVNISENSECQVQNFVRPGSEILPVFDSIFQENDGHWSKINLKLSVSEQQGLAMDQFLPYLQDTSDELGDETLEQEVGLLIKLVELSNDI